MESQAGNRGLSLEFRADWGCGRGNFSWVKLREGERRTPRLVLLSLHPPRANPDPHLTTSTIDLFSSIMSDYNAADLSSILRTLSAFTSQPQYQPSLLTHPTITSNDNDDDAYEPSESSPPVPSHLSRPQSTPGRVSNHPPTASVLSASSTNPSGQLRPRTSSSNDLGDPSMITTWSGARSYLMKAMLQNEDLQRRIRRLIQRQHDHERQWWQGRESLLAKQKARVQKKRELDEVL